LDPSLKLGLEKKIEVASYPDPAGLAMIPEVSIPVSIPPSISQYHRDQYWID
jgi:hypothetical protein